MQLQDLIEAGMPTALRLAGEWGLHLGDPFDHATGSLVLEAGEYVLRVPVILDEARSGYEAQLAFSGQGGVDVIRHDSGSLATLLKRVRPGRMLSEAGLSPVEEVRAACSVIRRFDVDSIPHRVPIERWYEPFLGVGHAENIPDDLLIRAQTVAGRLLSSMGRRRLFHGDLHHFNLLLHGKEWVAIDPQGIWAELDFEPAAFLRNPYDTIHQTEDLAALLAVRVNTFAEELGVSAGRVRDWGIAQSVLSAWWDPPEERIGTIKVVEALLAGS